MEATSAYERIKAHVGEDGKLPVSFSLDKKHAPNELSFMPGVMDGITVFHAGRHTEDKAVKKIVALLRKYMKTGKERYIAGVEAALNGGRTISMIDPILQSFRDHHKGIDLKKMIGFSVRLLKGNGSIELIKIGIGLLGLFDLGNSDEAVEVVTTLALYDDFTLYAVVAASNWTNGNSLIFQIAKGVSGWGKIHAVRRLEPENEEIRDWILRSGCANGIMDAYLGLVCATKGGLISALRQETVDPGLFDSIAVIIAALLDEGPVSGISAYEHAQEALTRFLYHAGQHATGVEHLWHMLNLKRWAENGEIGYRDTMLSGCAEIINREAWQGEIMAAVKRHSGDFEFFCACDAAFRLNMDISAELFAIVKVEPLKYCSYIPRLMKNPDMAASIIALCEAVLPLNQMAEGMGDDLFADKLNQEHLCLNFVLPELGAYTLQGIPLIKTGLHSRVVRSRNMACRALSGWVKAQGKPLSEISPELHAEIARIHQIEVNEQIKETIQKLLSGGTGDA